MSPSCGPTAPWPLLLPPLAMAGAASGVAVEDGCVQAFLDIKRKRAHRFVLYRIGARDERASAAPDAAPLQRRPRAAR